MRYYIIVFSLVVMSCVNTTKRFPIEYQFLDNPEERRIELKYQNNLQETVCFVPEEWPNKAGKINQASHYFFLIVDQERFPIVDFNTGYCPDDCAIRVAPGEEISAYISYNDFSLPEGLVNMEKTLKFYPKAFKCRARK